MCTLVLVLEWWFGLFWFGCCCYLFRRVWLGWGVVVLVETALLPQNLIYVTLLPVVLYTYNCLKPVTVYILSA